MAASTTKPEIDMKVTVRQEWGGHENFRFRLSYRFRDGFEYIHIFRETWNREAATLALNIIETHGINRRNVRFHHI